jgi:transcriptional regulator with XRE-family HTH domain
MLMKDLRLSKALKGLIQSKNIKVVELSRATRVPVQTIHNWLSGQKPRDIVQVKAVADFFRMSIDELCFGKPIVDPDSDSVERNNGYSTLSMPAENSEGKKK